MSHYDLMSQIGMNRSVEDDEWEAISEVIPDEAFDGWVVVWRSPAAVGLGGMATLGLDMPSEAGVNALYVAYPAKDSLLDLVIGATVLGGCAKVFDLEAFQ